MRTLTILDLLTDETHTAYVDISDDLSPSQLREGFTTGILARPDILAMYAHIDLGDELTVDDGPRLVVTEVDGVDLAEWLDRIGTS